VELSQGIIFFDVSIVIFMLVLAYLSNRLGEALKIPAYYKILYSTAGIVIGALILDVLAATIAAPFFLKVALIIRFAAGLIACVVVFRYWIWVFSEFFKH
jgi:hypothetical protein